MVLSLNQTDYEYSLFVDIFSFGLLLSLWRCLSTAHRLGGSLTGFFFGGSYRSVRSSQSNSAADSRESSCDPSFFQEKQLSQTCRHGAQHMGGGGGGRSGGSSTTTTTTTTTLMPQPAAVVHISPSPSSGDLRASAGGNGEGGTLLSSPGSPQGEHSPRRVSWDQNIVDNENMAKKKSKKCCIFHKKKPFGESSSESDSSSSGDSSGDEKKANHHGGQGEGAQDGHSGCKKCIRETRQKNLDAAGGVTEGQTS